MTNFLLYKLKQFWIRRYTWRWCFDWKFQKKFLGSYEGTEYERAVAMGVSEDL